MDSKIETYLRRENAALQAEVKVMEAKIEKLEAERKGFVLAAALKFGTMRAPGVMEMALNTRYMGESATDYEVTVTDHYDRNECVVRVRRV